MTCIWIREQGLTCLHIVLSAYDEEEPKVKALDPEQTTMSLNLSN
jgi:hypothetical protein